jgi:hypothetical protein
LQTTELGAITADREMQETYDHDLRIRLLL